MKPSSLGLPLAILALGVSPSFSRAQTVTLTGAPSLQSYSHYVTLGSDPASEETAYDALQEFTVSSTMPTSLEVPSPLNLFCIELGTDAPGTGNAPSTVTYTILPLADADQGRSSTSMDAYSGIPSSGIGSATATKLEDLYGYVFGSSYTNASPLNITASQIGISGSPSYANSGYDSAVFQLAVWNVVETDSFSNIATSGTSGSGFYAYVPGFTPTPADATTLIADTDNLLSAVAADSNVLPLNLDVLDASGAQDYILPDPTGSYLSITQIPEPAPTALILAAAACLVAVRRRPASILG
jgi:hypothetical protein